MYRFGLPCCLCVCQANGGPLRKGCWFFVQKQVLPIGLGVDLYLSVFPNHVLHLNNTELIL